MQGRFKQDGQDRQDKDRNEPRGGQIFFYPVYPVHPVKFFPCNLAFWKFCQALQTSGVLVRNVLMDDFNRRALFAELTDEFD